MKKRLWIFLFLFLFCFFGFFLILRFLFYKTYDGAYFGIETYKSSRDFDNDGIDDATDILQSARDYIATKPKYKSEYYKGGYPSGNYGVCTDVVGFGLLGAGYDLMELVNEDIKKDKEVYGISVIDKNIDFRRVVNLNIYFKRNAITLTNDISKIQEWQGGDIVVFPSHIGIVSDKRNSKGVPLVLHHARPFQISYEEDALKSYEIIGHYRMS